VIAFAVLAIPAGIPGQISQGWRNFKNYDASALGNDSLARFGTVSGNGRYDYWKLAVNSTGGHVLGGSGPGTFQLLWLPHSPQNFSYIQNAHSLYFETLAEEGVVGLGLLVNVVVDQHFEQRTRLGRLLAVVAQSPALIGLGLDEDTAAIVDADDVLEVIGRGSVTVVDGSDVITDAFHASGHKPMMVSNARIHSLPSGYRFDLRARRVLPLDVSKNERIAALAQGRIGKLARQVAAEGADSRAPERRRYRQEDRKASE